MFRALLNGDAGAGASLASLEIHRKQQELAASIVSLGWDVSAILLDVFTEFCQEKKTEDQV